MRIVHAQEGESMNKKPSIFARANSRWHAPKSRAAERIWMSGIAVIELVAISPRLQMLMSFQAPGDTPGFRDTREQAQRHCGNREHNHHLFRQM
jgi:hypothetical protein